jgi:Domain of unknown function (DUF4158)
VSVSESHRLEILTTSEIDDVFGLPRFTGEDRRLYFDLSSAELEVCKAYTFPVSAHFVLPLGYFKATQRFFAYERDDVVADLQHIVELHFQDRDPALLRMAPVAASSAQRPPPCFGSGSSPIPCAAV